MGGATSVGQLATQLAKAKGVWVATTASTRNLSYVSQFGADLVVNYNEQKWEELEELKGIDAFTKATIKGVVKADGAFVSIVNPSEVGYNPSAHPPLKFAAFYALNNDTAVQDELAAKLADGSLKITIDTVFPFTQEGVHALFARLNSGASNGKNVLKIV